MARINAEIAALQARTNLGAAARALELESAGSEFQFRAGLLELEIALEDAQIKRIEVEAKLKALSG